MGPAAIIERSGIFHQRERKSRMRLRLVHDFLGGLIVVGVFALSVAAPIPIDDDTVQAATDHVIHLFPDLKQIIGDIPDINVVAESKPGHQMRVDPEVAPEYSSVRIGTLLTLPALTFPLG